MKQEIESREMAEMAVIVLLNGTKSKIAVRDDDGHLKLENHSILTQYLNPYHNRKKMTKKLADTLSLAFQYYLLSGDDNKQIDICARAIMFIYAISSVDLTYWHYDIAKGKEKTKQEAILSLVDALFHAFQGKEKVKGAELQNLVYTTAISRHWRIDTKPMKISIAGYNNILNTYLNYDMIIYQLNGNDEEKTFRKYGNYYIMPDDVTTESFHAGLHNRADKVIDKISIFLHFVSDLLETDDLNLFKQKYTKLEYEILRKPIIKNNKWKIQVLTCYLKSFSFQEIINDLLYELSFTNLYLLYNALLNILYERISELRKKYASEKSAANSELFECSTFKHIIINIRDSIRYIQLQARVNIEIGTFGSCHCMKNSVRTNRITNSRELIRVMVEYLFYGVGTKIGKEYDNCFSSQKLKEIRSDIVYKYLNGKQKKFTNHVYDALKYRVRYYLYPNERSDGKETTTSPQQFGELLWQFFYYTFGIDFYMLRMNNSDDRTRKAYWYELVCKVFKRIMNNRTIPELDEMLNQEFVMLQFKMEGMFISRFTPNEIDYFRHQEILGLTKYDMIHKRAMLGESDQESLLLAEDIIKRLVEAKMADMLDRIDKEKENTQLDEFMQWICTGVIANRHQNLKIDFSEIKEKLWILINEFFEMEQISYKTLYGESYRKAEEEKFNAINEKFLESDKIQNVNLMLQRMYKYLLYEDWIDANLKLTWL